MDDRKGCLQNPVEVYIILYLYKKEKEREKWTEKN